MRRSGFRNASIVSRLKALLSVVEDFVRADAASLGKTSSGATWNNIRGAWAIATNKASTSTAGSSYPISTLTFTQEDVTISVGGVGPGMGTAFWVTDSNNWWGAYIDGVQTCQTCTTPGNPSTYAYNYVSGGNCATYSTVPGNCATYSTVPGNCATYSTVPGNCATYSTSCSYPCNATNAASYPCNAYNKSYPCNAYNPVVPGNCNAYNAATPGTCSAYNGSNCTTYSTSCSTYAYNASSYNARTYQCYPGAPGNAAPGVSCGLTFAQSQACGGCKTSAPTLVPGTSYCSGYSSTCNAYNASNCAAYNPATPGNCAAYNAATGGNCATWSTVDVSCATYSTVPGNCSTYSTSCSYPCNATNATSYPCNVYNPTAYPCNVYNPTYYPCNVYNPITYATVVTSYNAATYYTCNCVTDNKINIIKMIAGTLTTVATLSFASTIASFKAILSGSTITIQAFTGTNYTTQIGTNQATTVSGYTKSKKHGILKGVVTYAPSDTSVIDEFRVG